MSRHPLSPSEIESRERDILMTTLSFLENDDIYELTIDKIAEQSSYSKGTIYKHFTCKEDLLLEVAVFGLGEILKEIIRVSKNLGYSRQRYVDMMLSYLYFSIDSPKIFNAYVLCKSAVVMKKASSKRLSRLASVEQSIMEKFISVIDDGLAEGELELPSCISQQQAYFRVWSSGYGVLSLLRAELFWENRGNDLYIKREFLNTIDFCLDAMGWKRRAYSSESYTAGRGVAPAHG